LQCVAVCCSVIKCVQCVVACCTVLQCVAFCCIVRQCVGACCSVLQHVSVCCCETNHSHIHTYTNHYINVHTAGKSQYKTLSTENPTSSNPPNLKTHTHTRTHTHTASFLGNSWYKSKVRFWFDLNLYWEMWGSGYGGCRGSTPYSPKSIFSGICHIMTLIWVASLDSLLHRV